MLEAAGALLRKGGYPAATIEAISADSGVAKTTIYRWWSNRAALVVELLLQRADQAAAPATLGKDMLRGIHDEMQRVALAAQGEIGRLLLSLVAEAQHDPAVREALVTGLFAPRRAATAEVIRAAQAAGLLRDDLPAPLIGDLLFGPFFYRSLIRQEPASAEFVSQVFEVVLAGAGTSRQASHGRRSSLPKAARRPRARAPRA